ncbi:hypothetical protein HHI36_002028 [Cryptolaemus montrouzieri]|uniref:Uncharacterized protein n=1 Tax=Cryptolaemus montrouzieri TaxID=559131 RepID=A0ABD2PA11_9CUCU
MDDFCLENPCYSLIMIHIWSLIRANIGKTRKKEKIPIDIDDHCVSNPREVVNAYANYFLNITKKTLIDKFDDERTTKCSLPKKSNANSFFFRACETDEIVRVINSLKPKGSVGTDSN